MAGFNKSGVAVSKAVLTSGVTSVLDNAAATFEGGTAFGRDAKSELFLLAVSNMVGEDTFYEGASERDQRFRTLVRVVATEDPEWVSRFIPWLRQEANMRTASVVAAVEFAQAHKGLVNGVSARSVVASALQRADEPGEALAYCKTRGYPVAGGLQRGIADAAQRLYNERNLLKYDGQSKGFRFGDVLELTHAKPAAAWQGDLFKYAIDRRHDRDDITIPQSCKVLSARATLERIPVSERRNYLGDSNLLGLAGMTWESLSGWLQGPMDAKAWEAIIPQMGYMALLRNLRNFDQAGVSDSVAAAISTKLSSLDEVRRSRQFPMRFLSAYKAAPSLRWSWPLEQALEHSLSNVPTFKGSTLVLVDTSGSMGASFSRDGSLAFWEAAALFGIAVARQSDTASVVSYSTRSVEFPLITGESTLKTLERFRSNYFLNGGTSTAAAVQAHYRGQDRVVLLTDEQASYGRADAAVPTSVPFYTYNLAGYRYGNTPSGSDNRHTFGGLSDSGFKVMALLEAGRSGSWPF